MLDTLRKTRIRYYGIPILEVSRELSPRSAVTAIDSCTTGVTAEVPKAAGAVCD
jgi:hypothetical protein